MKIEAFFPGVVIGAMVKGSDDQWEMVVAPVQLGISFSGAGFLGIYHFGVINALYKHGHRYCTILAITYNIIINCSRTKLANNYFGRALRSLRAFQLPSL